MLRHFATAGNISKRYIGSTDEELCQVGKDKINNMNYPQVDAVYASPLKRCVETASLIYPNQLPNFDKDLCECNFGDFENKNYMELEGNPDYQAWIDSNGTLPFPNGENIQDYKNRSVAAFDRIIEESIENGYNIISLVAHGGTIMSILDRYSDPHEDYYYWKAENGNGYMVEFDEKVGRASIICSIH